MKKVLQQKKVLKLHTKELIEHNWNMVLDINALLDQNDERIVDLGSSQLLRWIDMLNRNEDSELICKHLRQKIRNVGKEEMHSRSARNKLEEYRSRLYQMKFMEDYLLLVIDRKSDYAKANRGFKVNGIQYHRMVGTSGGVKNSTIVYVSERLYPELKRRLDNKRNMEQKLVPAKLEAYQGLICSASVPVPMPKGIIVVKDCITRFKDDVILLDDSVDDEPKLEFIKDYAIEHNGSDGFGLISPSYASRVGKALQFDERPVPGFTCRYAWTKGMLYTFDFVEFAEKVAGTYFVEDV